MALSWNEIKTRAASFVLEWKDETREKAESQSFWNAFFKVFGLSRRRVASFEKAVEKASGGTGFIDLFWPGVLLVEQKSLGENLEMAYGQALDYFPGLSDKELPRYVLVSDFARFRLYDLDEKTDVQFALTELLEHIHDFGFIAGYERRIYHEENPVNIEAAELMGRLHDELKDIGYSGHALEVYLVRLLFCLYADDTGIFQREQLQEYLEVRTSEDGSDLALHLAHIFQVLNTPVPDRLKTLDEDLAALAYVNGQLFVEHLPMAAFNTDMRALLLQCCGLDWGAISPAIFGSMFQSVMDRDARRSMGAHYTSEQNILKLIGPLFMDDLWAEFKRAEARNSRPELNRFREKLGSLRLCDPACGCGNFLVVAYRELRLLEIEVLRTLYRTELQRGLQVLNIADLLLVNVDQFFGIEIEEFPAQIAQVAMWLMDHQMNLKVAEVFGTYFTRLPLTRAAQICHGNALSQDWTTCFDDDQDTFDYLLGNPPFVGAKYQSQGQKADLKSVLHGIPSSGLLDYVTGWYIKAAQYMQQHQTTRTAFVSTNSISQGEQVGVLWNELLNTYSVIIHFAHRTFQWTNEARGKAAVHVVIIGFALHESSDKRLFEYNDIRSVPHERSVSIINPYLVEGPNVFALRRSAPLCEVPSIGIGNKPIDGGHYLFTPQEKNEFLVAEPKAAPYFRRWIGAQEFLNETERWCLWLGDCPPQELRQMPEAMNRVEAVRQNRFASKSAPTRKLASTPTRFHVENMPKENYLVIPKVSSMRRAFIPVGYLPPEVLASDLVFVSSDATLYHLGVLSSTMHMSWVRYTGGRLKSDYRYSVKIVYNNFPWPEGPAEKRRVAVETATQAVLDARQPHLDTGATLADLYDPLSMPPTLVKAHAQLDREVDLCYRPQPFPDETRRIVFLFERYEALTNSFFKK